ncbi:MAG: hypothetical protein COW03_14600 [Cytophagales bacterium CG12_big_fil_rev_8_21_14_0_65_40_12]|nr:MAG: hypothetical protein COW03_14600 [Cytophagales bacterium CG12_big_fil_rev_8_21_14_0_65_40_12]PIW04331.1 MAG: hypothetical protein COW40_10330 [Cytophagales bacterium CG17_big_fil_post_rev_8_21_14_2_50_40_13]
MKNGIYSIILMGGLAKTGLPTNPRVPVKMPSPTSNNNPNPVLDKRQGYSLILDLPEQRRAQKNAQQSHGLNQKDGFSKVAYSETIMGCNYKAFIETEAPLHPNTDQEHLYNYMVENYLRNAMIH